MTQELPESLTIEETCELLISLCKHIGKERDELRAEVELARKRLGPAGYRILTDLREWKEYSGKLREALDSIKTFYDSKDWPKVRDALSLKSPEDK